MSEEIITLEMMKAIGIRKNSFITAEGVFSEPIESYEPEFVHHQIEVRDSTITRLEGEVAELVEGYTEATHDIDDWGAYAGSFFQDKHDLKGCVANHRERLAKHQSVKGNDDGTM